MTGTCALLHFMVDGLCLCCLYQLTPEVTHIVAFYVTYNVLAFLTQPLTGWWADRIRHRHWMLLLAVALFILAVATAVAADCMQMAGDRMETATTPLLYVTATLLGIGNSLFHVWGGKQTAIRTGNDIRALGVFVSTGAFGLAVSAVFHSWALLYALLLGICTMAVMYLRWDSMEEEGEEEQRTGQLSWGIIVCVVAGLMQVVALRSFVGESFSAPITKTSGTLLLLGAVAMTGKMTGGWLVKSIGMVKAIVLMVVAAVACWLGKDLHAGVMLLGLFMMNCTMPVTLYWANVMLKGKEGFAFGLLAAALIPGYLLATL